MKNSLRHIILRIKYLFAKPKYCIKRGYIHRNSVPHFDDINNKDEWQNEVYAFAKDVFDKKNYNNILDIGCGSAFKLFKFFERDNFTGVEVEPTLSKLRSKYPNHKWYNLDEIDQDASFDLIILADVIEHIRQPDEFLIKILSKLSFKQIIISTPERDLVRGKDNWGPPANIHHFREWNDNEFLSFTEKFLTIDKHFIVEDESTTQIILASSK